jgi:hypothetical protein
LEHHTDQANDRYPRDIWQVQALVRRQGDREPNDRRSEPTIHAQLDQPIAA